MNLKTDENQINRSGLVKKARHFFRKPNLVTIVKSTFDRFYHFIELFSSFFKIITVDHISLC
jgi:hypothetical protein